jgi:hypothetical protein
VSSTPGYRGNLKRSAARVRTGRRHLEELRVLLDADGIHTEVRPTTATYSIGADQALICSRR